MATGSSVPGSMTGTANTSTDTVAPTGRGMPNGLASLDATAQVPLSQLGHATGGGSALTQTAVQTSAYTATANQIVPVNTTSGNVTITLPTAPAAGTMVAVKHIIQGGTNTVTVATAGTDVINKTGGSVSMTLTLPNQGVLLEYNTGIWVNLADDLPLSQLDNRYLPQTQSYTQVSGTYTPLFTVQGNGGTDTVPPFQIAAGAGTYGVSTPILGPVLGFGYNAVNAMSHTASTHGAATISFFADAGDTNNGAGGHGIELNLSFFTPNASGAVAAFQIVAVDDNTNTETTSIRCGNGTSGSIGSFINFTNADASVTFLTMSHSAALATFSVPVTMTTNAAAATNYSFKIQARGTTSAVIVLLDGNNGTNSNSQILFSTAGVTQWNINHGPPYLITTDSVNSRTAIIMYPGTVTSAKMYVNSAIQSVGSMVVGAAAVATTATTGFLYLPSCAGTPTGTPAVFTGTVPAVYDTTGGKLWLYRGGAWAGVVI